MKETGAVAGVLPVGNGDDPRYLTLTGAESMTLDEWERHGRPCWSVRWISTVELPGGEARPEYLYARTYIPCHERCIVAGVPPFDAVGVEYGYDLASGSNWYAPAVVRSDTLGAARSLVRDVRAAGGPYITWDRSLMGRDHMRYQLDTDHEPEYTGRPVYPGESRDTAAGKGWQPGDKLPVPKPNPKPPTVRRGPRRRKSA